jgi:hypothetical protein
MTLRSDEGTNEIELLDLHVSRFVFDLYDVGGTSVVKRRRKVGANNGLPLRRLVFQRKYPVRT